MCCAHCVLASFTILTLHLTSHFTSCITAARCNTVQRKKSTVTQAACCFNSNDSLIHHEPWRHHWWCCCPSHRCTSLGSGAFQQQQQQQQQDLFGERFHGNGWLLFTPCIGLPGLVIVQQQHWKLTGSTANSSTSTDKLRPTPGAWPTRLRAGLHPVNEEHYSSKKRQVLNANANWSQPLVNMCVDDIQVASKPHGKLLKEAWCFEHCDSDSDSNSNKDHANGEDFY